ncbi:hypothetical protein [Roseovarius sp.]|uniref:hypothetical protein n=1 Tax=Roseovarius sp. TaxID=1486281 RepID=UPI00260D7CF5|nr:hypothetical protein [Roseovarius sp.]MDM8167014.1 hypothetical protein [Roseovarius sp.]
MTEPAVSIVDAMTDPMLFGPTFGGESFAAWRALLGGFYGLPMDEDEAETFKALTGRSEAPTRPHGELWLAIGRRGGKTQAGAVLALYEACLRDHRDKLSSGEVATVMVIAADRRQARTAMRYISGLVNDNPMLRRMVKRETTEEIEFNNRCTIEVHTASFRAVRGYTLAAVIADEVAFWHVDGANPDAEIIAALRPALATLGAPLIALSSPYAKRGVLWNQYRRHYGEGESSVLVAQAASRTMNPTLPERVVDDAMKDDAARASAEYLAHFRSDIATLLAPELIENAMRPKPLEIPPANGLEYIAFTDPAGGGSDEFTMAIGHKEEAAVVVDLVRGLRGSPAQIVEEFAAVLKKYGIRRVTGDRYAGRWPRDEFQKHSIEYQVSELDRSGLYLELLAAMNSGRVELPCCKKTARQLGALERRTSRSGRDLIDHPPGGNDDRANAVAGLVADALANRGPAMVRVKRLRGF